MYGEDTLQGGNTFNLQGQRGIKNSLIRRGKFYVKHPLALVKIDLGNIINQNVYSVSILIILVYLVFLQD